MKVKLDHFAYLPTRAHDTDAGLDLYTPFDIKIMPGSSTSVNTGVHIELPPYTVGMLKSKSGLNVKHGIVSEGVIDEGYSGSIVVKLYNHGSYPVTLHKGSKITQLVVLPVLYVDVEQADELRQGDRGENGFGSTGT